MIQSVIGKLGVQEDNQTNQINGECNGISLECATVFPEGILLPVLMCYSKSIE